MIKLAITNQTIVGEIAAAAKASAVPGNVLDAWIYERMKATS
jgi:hypothetical protein